MRRQSLCTVHMEIKKNAYPGRQSKWYAFTKYHKYNTPGATGCQMEENMAMICRSGAAECTGCIHCLQEDDEEWQEHYMK